MGTCEDETATIKIQYEKVKSTDDANIVNSREWILCSIESCEVEQKRDEVKSAFQCSGERAEVGPGIDRSANRIRSNDGYYLLDRTQRKRLVNRSNIPWILFYFL